MAFSFHDRIVHACPLKIKYLEGNWRWLIREPEGELEGREMPERVKATDLPPRPHWAEPKLIAEVRFVEWTRDGMVDDPDIWRAVNLLRRRYGPDSDMMAAMRAYELLPVVASCGKETLGPVRF